MTNKKKIIAVVAYEPRRGIGYQGQLPWPPLKGDLKRFKEMTIGHSVIMGRNTWESIPAKHRPLVDRQNIVLTSRPITDAFPAYSVPDAIGLAESDTIFVIGGAKVYKSFLDMDLIDEIVATEVAQPYVCDTFFPELSEGWLLSMIVSEKDYDVYRYWKG